MTQISFEFEDTHSIYINTIKSGDDVVLAPKWKGYKNLNRFDISGPDASIIDHEVGDIDNSSGSDTYITDTVTVSQAVNGPVLFRALVKCIDVPATRDDNWGLYWKGRHFDASYTPSFKLNLPTGKFGWSQFSANIESPDELPFQYVYPYLMLRNSKTGHAQFKHCEIIPMEDFENAEKAEKGFAYSKPECIYEPVEPETPQGTLALPIVPFYYGTVEDIGLEGSPSRAIEILSEFDNIVINKPASHSEAALYVTDAIKSTVNIFGYTNMGGRDLALVKAEIDTIEAQGWYGVFVDEFDFSYATRQEQNEIIDYIHGLDLIAFVNSSFPDHVFDDTVDVDDNPTGDPTTLEAGDFWLQESFLMNDTGYRSDSESVLDTYIERYLDGKTYAETLGINACVISKQRSVTTWEEAEDDAKLSYLAALLLGYSGWYFVDELSPEAFLYRPDPNINIGDSIVSKLEQLMPYWYIAETDKYIFVFSTEDYPPMSYTVYDKSRRRDLPTDVDILYSDDFETWKEYNPDMPGIVGKFVRQKLVLP